MKKVRIGINGFGRIGRIAARIIHSRKDVELAAINSRADIQSHAYLLKYDSTYSAFDKEVEIRGDYLVVDGSKVAVFNKDNPSDIPWNKAGIDIVIEATGRFRTKEDMAKHLGTSVKKVVLSAPAKDDTKTLVLGVNEYLFEPKKDQLISNSSCTTNCLATVLKVLHRHFQVKRGFMTTIHAVTDSQNLLDNSHHKEIRLRRASFASMIPSSTGSARDIGKLFPDLSGKIFCQAVRVPLFTVSLIDLVMQVKKKTTSEKVNQTFDQAAKEDLSGILSVAREQLVSRDFQGSTFSSIVDPFLTLVVQDNLVKVAAWYDNEWGYTSRLVDMVSYIAKRSKL